MCFRYILLMQRVSLFCRKTYYVYLVRVILFPNTLVLDLFKEWYVYIYQQSVLGCMVKQILLYSTLLRVSCLKFF